MKGNEVNPGKNCKVVPANERGHRIGESHPRAKLTDHEVDLLLELRAEGYSYSWLALKFEITKKHAWRLCNMLQRAQTPAKWRRVLDQE